MGRNLLHRAAIEEDIGSLFSLLEIKFEMINALD
jgi:hypothetical protein